MTRLLRLILSNCVIVVATAFSSFAQSTPPVVPESNTIPATPAPPGQAPDEATKKISDLVHAGKYAEAQQLTNGLLIAYPNDQRLIKAKGIIEQALSSHGATGTAMGSNQPAQPASNATQLTGMDKVEYNSLILLAQQAQQSVDLTEQTKLLKQFMDQSSVFLQKHPDDMLLWGLRAQSAISLDELMEGYEAGQKLLEEGAADSNNQTFQLLLAQLNNKGWLDKQKVQALQESIVAAQLKAENDKYTFPVERLLGHFVWTPDGYGHLTINENDLVYDGSDGHLQLSKSEIHRIDIYGWSIEIVPKNGKSIDFYPATEDAVSQKQTVVNLQLPATAVKNALVERWKFVAEGKGLGADSHQTLSAPAATLPPATSPAVIPAPQPAAKDK